MFNQKPHRQAWRRSGSLLTFLKQSQLRTQEQILGRQCCAAAEKSTAEADAIRNENLKDNSQPQQLPEPT